MKYLIKESQYNNAIDKFITYQFEPHEEKRTKKYSKLIFWVKEGEIIAEIEKSKYFWVNDKIWMNIMSVLSLEYDETQQVIKDWLEEHYKLGRLKPFWYSEWQYTRLEEHYKLK